MNIYAKLTSLCLFLVIISSAVIFFFSNLRVKKAYKEEVQITIGKQAESAISAIEEFMFSRLNDVRLASKNPYFVETANNNTEALTKKLQELEQLNHIYYSFAYYNNDRIKIADSKQQSIGQQSNKTEIWQKINDNNQEAVSIIYSDELKQPIMQFAAAVKNAEGNEREGILIGTVLVGELFKIMREISLGDDNSRKLVVNLLENNGELLYSNAETDTKSFAHKELISQIKDERVNFFELENELIFLAKQRSTLDYTGNGWILAISIDAEKAYLPIKEIQNEMLQVIIVVLIFSIVLALIASRFFVKPIVKLSKAAEELRHGNLNVEIDVNSNDEIGTLANQLSQSSQILIDKLEEQKETAEQLSQQKEEIEDQKQQLEISNKKITDSIIYAQRIQKSILPEVKSIARVVKDAFVIYKPKDVVSGDFYWFERIRQGRNEYLVIACADCTGHGVPGAIMSIMGSNLLTNIIYYQNYLDPVKILARMNKLIKMELQRDVTDKSSSKDGMEMGICVINLDDLNMEFAGVGIPLYLIRNGELETYKTPKLMIGGIEGDEREALGKLRKEEITLNEGDKLYLSSDGFQDQFGGTDDKKFMSKNFRNLLLETSALPIAEQQTKIDEAFEAWKEGYAQTDDVAVLGIEI